MVDCMGGPPREIWPPALGLPPRERPSRSFSSDCPGSAAGDACPGAAGILDACADAAASSGPPKSMRDNSLSGPLETPAPLVPRVPWGILEAPSMSPFCINRYLSNVRCMLSLISKSLATASWSSDSS